MSIFKDPIECYEAIGAALSKAAVKHSWDHISLDATLQDQQVDTIVECWQDNQAEPVAYLTGIPKLAHFIYDLARLVSTQDKGLFKKCSFTLYSGGKFDVGFIY